MYKFMYYLYMLYIYIYIYIYINSIFIYNICLDLLVAESAASLGVRIIDLLIKMALYMVFGETTSILRVN